MLIVLVTLRLKTFQFLPHIHTFLMSPHVISNSSSHDHDVLFLVSSRCRCSYMIFTMFPVTIVIVPDTGVFKASCNIMLASIHLRHLCYDFIVYWYFFSHRWFNHKPTRLATSTKTNGHSPTAETAATRDPPRAAGQHKPNWPLDSSSSGSGLTTLATYCNHSVLRPLRQEAWSMTRDVTHDLSENVFAKSYSLLFVLL